MTTIAAVAHAKINWCLELLRKREDGYHEIRTVTHTVSLGDRLAISSAPEGVSLSVAGEWDVPEGEGNLCHRAARAYLDAVGATSGLRVELEKRVPPGSGLGGGSSDAVAVLLAAERLNPPSDPELVPRLAAQLGSDTSLFLYGGAALCSGRGEIVTQVPCPRTYHLVLARPDFGVSTAEAYGLIEPGDFTPGAQAEAFACALAAGAAPGELARYCVNTFSRAVCGRHPLIRQLVDRLVELGAQFAQMTGSGSAVFGVFSEGAQADAAAARLRAAGCFSVAARTVPTGVKLSDTTGADS